MATSDSIDSHNLQGRVPHPKFEVDIFVMEITLNPDSTYLTYRKQPIKCLCFNKCPTPHPDELILHRKIPFNPPPLHAIQAVNLYHARLTSGY